MKTAISVMAVLVSLTLAIFSDVANCKAIVANEDKDDGSPPKTYGEETKDLILKAYKIVSVACDVVIQTVKAEPAPEQVPQPQETQQLQIEGPQQPQIEEPQQPQIEGPQQPQETQEPQPPLAEPQSLREHHHPGDNSPTVAALLTGQEAPQE